MALLLQSPRNKDKGPPGNQWAFFYAQNVKVFMTDEAHRNRPTGASPMFYLSMLPGLVSLAKEYGYALGVHGSLARDFDLMAIPWTDEARSADELIKAIMDATGAARRKRDWEQKPHQRKAFSLYLGGGPYLDISVMPRSCDAPHHVMPSEVIHDEGNE